MALKQTAVLYHYPCPDGAFAALAAHIYFSVSSIPALFFPNTVYSPIKVEDLPTDQIGDAYLLDFVGPPAFARTDTTCFHSKLCRLSFSPLSVGGELPFNED